MGFEMYTGGAKKSSQEQEGPQEIEQIDLTQNGNAEDSANQSPHSRDVNAGLHDLVDKKSDGQGQGDALEKVKDVYRSI